MPSMPGQNSGASGYELLAMRKSAEEMMAYQRQDCPFCAWPLQESPDRILHCRFCGWTDTSPIIRNVPRP